MMGHFSGSKIKLAKKVVRMRILDDKHSSKTFVKSVMLILKKMCCLKPDQAQSNCPVRQHISH